MELPIPSTSVTTRHSSVKILVFTPQRYLGRLIIFFNVDKLPSREYMNMRMPIPPSVTKFGHPATTIFPSYLGQNDFPV